MFRNELSFLQVEEWRVFAIGIVDTQAKEAGEVEDEE